MTREMLQVFDIIVCDEGSAFAFSPQLDDSAVSFIFVIETTGVRQYSNARSECRVLRTATQTMADEVDIVILTLLFPTCFDCRSVCASGSTKMGALAVDANFK